MVARPSPRTTGRRCRVVIEDDTPTPFFKRDSVQRVLLVMATAFVAGIGAGVYHTVKMQRHLAKDEERISAEVARITADIPKFEECRDSVMRIGLRDHGGATYEEIVAFLRDWDSAPRRDTTPQD